MKTFTLSSQDQRAGGLTCLASPFVLGRFMPYTTVEKLHSGLLRKSKPVPIDTGSFIKPLKQSFIKNARLMPGTRVMLALLAGWNGKEVTICTTMGTIGKHLGRSTRQVFRYLKDAVEEGYLVYSRTKDRLGYYTGIRIWLNSGAVRHSYNVYKAKRSAEYRAKQDMTHKADTNLNLLLKEENDDELTERLAGFARKLGIFYDP